MTGIEKTDLGIDENMKIREYLMEIIRGKAVLLIIPRIQILPAPLWSDLLEKYWEKM